MAIEKMSLVSIEGPIKKVNKTLLKCCESKCFHIVSSVHGGDLGTSPHAGGFRMLKSKNIYASLVKRAADMARRLNIKLVDADYNDIDYAVSIDFVSYFDELDEGLKELYSEKEELSSALKEYSLSLTHLDQLVGMDANFEEIFACKYTKFRFGRMPEDSYKKLRYFEDMNFCFFPFETADDYIWGVYFTPKVESAEVDDIFRSMFFERVKMPDYLKGTADEAKTAMLKLMKADSDKLDTINLTLLDFIKRHTEEFIKVFSKLKALSESYELRTNVSVLNNKFYALGFIPTRNIDAFKKLFADISGLNLQVKPHDSDPTLKPPVKLRNNWLFRPFEMFINMYGLPDYNGLDPTPYVAVTYMLIFGIMFGDLGQGLVISLLGLIIGKWKHAKLAPIMTRIGISSAIFGTLYGSVFGIETIITPFYHLQPVYTLLGFATAPKDIFQISSMLLISALALGVFLILISMTMNIVAGLKTRDYESAFFSANGVTGFVLYASLIVGAALQLGLGIAVFSPVYVGCLIVLPLIILFFKAPINDLLNKFINFRQGVDSNKSNAIYHAIKSYSDAVSPLETIFGTANAEEELLNSGKLKIQYGKISLDSYNSIKDISDMQFMFFPFELDDRELSGAFITLSSDYSKVEKFFNTKGFLKLKLPEHIVDHTKQKALHFMIPLNEINKEKKSVGTFIIESFIGLFESALTYVTNTMSFLRIGGFILSHAGMMLVVGVLAETAGGGAPIVMILGNAFVIGMEGFLVGIQVLRLEFYEIFSRFYKGGGKPFNPIVIDVNTNN